MKIGRDAQPIGAANHEPESRAEAAGRDYKSLISTGQDVRKRGEKLILATAGANPRFVVLTYPSRKQAKEGQILIRRELRACKSNEEYNAVMDSVLEEIGGRS